MVLLAHASIVPLRTRECKLLHSRAWVYRLLHSRARKYNRLHSRARKSVIVYTCVHGTITRARNFNTRARASVMGRVQTHAKHGSNITCAPVNTFARAHVILLLTTIIALALYCNGITPTKSLQSLTFPRSDTAYIEQVHPPPSLI